MPSSHVVIIGAGIGGLSAAMSLAAQGVRVTLLERAAAPGGKMRQVPSAAGGIDSGPTVFTMRWVFERIFAEAGTSLDAHLALTPASTIARHAWNAAERLDLFADIDRSADAIGGFAGAAESKGYRQFCARAAQIYRTLEKPFIKSGRPTPLGLVRSAGFAGLPDLWRISPFQTLWRALGEYFNDPRLRQLFGRYSTYCGSSPYHAPATLMLVAHVEQDGVWLVQGGMHQIAKSMARVAEGHGATLRYNAAVAEILVARGRATGVKLASGEIIEADAVLCNADFPALSAGFFGAAAAKAAPKQPPAQRSLSAITWAVAAPTAGFELVRHNVFFSADYKTEFDEIWARRSLPQNPTIYICAQDRGEAKPPVTGAERIFILVNAPATGDTAPFSDSEIAQCQARTLAHLAQCGLTIQAPPEAMVATSPQKFNAMFPATGGALYGSAVHGSMASFRRPGARSQVPGLYLAGGSTHPGAGVPMAALSGQQAAAALLADLPSTARSRPMAMFGGMSTR